MPNFKLPSALETAPSGVRTYPGALDRVDSRWRLIFGALAALLAVAGLWWVASLSGESGGPHRPPPPVYVGRAATRTVAIREQTIGTVLPNTSVSVTSQVTGQVLTVAFKEGQIVHQGDLLFQLDPKPFQAALAQAQSIVARDQATLLSDQHDAARYVALAKQGAASAQQRDLAVATANAMAATVNSDKAAVNIAQLNLNYATIRSPVTGQTGPVLIQTGNLVTANGSNPLVVINQIQPVKVSFSLPQADLAQIQNQMRANALIANVSVHGGTGPTETAAVDFVSNAVNQQTGTIELRATFGNSDFRLVPGELVDVWATLNTLHDATTVPREAVNIGENNRYVWVVTADGKAQMRPVQVIYDDGKLATIKGNVRPGDRVITDGQLRVIPGAAVSVQQQGAKSAR